MPDEHAVDTAASTLGEQLAHTNAHLRAEVKSLIEQREELHKRVLGELLTTATKQAGWTARPPGLSRSPAC